MWDGTSAPPNGSSPRVRSRLSIRRRSRGRTGIISACAEQTRRNTALPSRAWDHLRVCGADLDILWFETVAAGSSPRVRSRPRPPTDPPDLPGIISACAEQTRRIWATRCRARDHLRVCGADCPKLASIGSHGGSSPRVRSRPCQRVEHAADAGIISACAEQTLRTVATVDAGTDHLRVCGADGVQSIFVMSPRGSSPRVRSRPLARADGSDQLGIISACAEQTSTCRSPSAGSGDHLRVCGADALDGVAHGMNSGSSPRVRSRPCIHRPSAVHMGIISACAEQTVGSRR